MTRPVVAAPMYTTILTEAHFHTRLPFDMKWPLWYSPARELVKYIVKHGEVGGGKIRI